MARGPQVVLVLLLAGLAAGCVGPVPSGEGGLMSPAGEHLECAPTYPDGSAKDCTQDITRSAAPVVPAGWSCVHRSEGGYNGWSVRYDLLWDGADGWALWFTGHDSLPIEHAVVQYALRDLEGRDLVEPLVAAGTSAGFVELGKADAASGRFWVSARAFDISGEAQARVLANGLWEGAAWFTYAAPDGAWAVDGMVQATSADGSDPHVVVTRSIVTPEGKVTTEPTGAFGAFGFFTRPTAQLPEPVACDGLDSIGPAASSLEPLI